jgi:hypothetical protein
MIHPGTSQAERLPILNAQARAQLASLLTNPSLAQLRGGSLLGN